MRQSAVAFPRRGLCGHHDHSFLAPGGRRGSGLLQPVERQRRCGRENLDPHRRCLPDRHEHLALRPDQRHADQRHGQLQRHDSGHGREQLPRHDQLRHLTPVPHDRHHACRADKCNGGCQLYCDSRGHWRHRTLHLEHSDRFGSGRPRAECSGSTQRYPDACRQLHLHRSGA